MRREKHLKPTKDWKFPKWSDLKPDVEAVCLHIKDIASRKHHYRYGVIVGSGTRATFQAVEFETGETQNFRFPIESVQQVLIRRVPKKVKTD